MKDNPLVTVAIPAYNAEDTIAETLESILCQRYRNLEVIVVDDGSRDATPSIVRRLAESDDRVRLVQQENQGVGVARNRGIMEGSGDFIAPMDHDDIWHPEMLEKLIVVMKASGNRLGFVYTWYRCIDEDDIVVRDGPQYAFRGRILNRHLLVNPVNNGSALLMSRSAATDVGLYPTTFRREGIEGPEDMAMQLAIAEKYEVDLVPEFLVGYRMGADTMSRHRAGLNFSTIKIYKDKLNAHPELHPSLRRWTLGSRYLRYSTALARQGRLLDAGVAFVTTLALDPLEVVASGAGFIQVGARRQWKRGANRTPSIQNMKTPDRRTVARRFQDLDPREMSEQQSTNFVEMLRRARLRKLEAFDMQSRPEFSRG